MLSCKITFLLPVAWSCNFVGLISWYLLHALEIVLGETPNLLAMAHMTILGELDYLYNLIKDPKKTQNLSG